MADRSLTGSALPGRADVAWRTRTRTLTTRDHTLVMGVLNVTPDSFSDGGRFAAPSGEPDPQAAIAAGVAMWRDGADLVDVGGESTRPGSTGTTAGMEIARVVPVVAGLAAAGVVVSVDTRKAEVADAAVDAGAEVINDVSGLGDPAMAEVCARTGAGVVLMHMRGEPATMQQDPRYDDVVEEVADHLAHRVSLAVAAGVDRSHICIDPGIGFGKSFEHNITLLAGIDRLVATGLPVLIGTSRKGFLGAILEGAGHPAAPVDRDPATAATTALAISAGIAVIRAHNVADSVQVARTADAIVRSNRSSADGWSGD